MAPKATERLVGEEQGLDAEMARILTDQNEISDEDLDPELLAVIDEGLAYFEAGGEGITAEVVLQEMRQILNGG